MERRLAGFCCTDMARLGSTDQELRARYPRGRLYGWIAGLGVTCVMALPGMSTAQQAVPLPPPRPDRPIPQTESEKQPSKEEPNQQKTDAGNDPAAACIERIASLGLRFEKQPPVQDNACKIGNPVTVSTLPNGVEISPPSLMECSFAEGLARWVGDVVIPRTKEHFQSAPTKLLIGTSYQCRDQRSGGKLSEHAFGNGVDVMGFEFDKHPPLTIKFQAENSPEAAFQLAVQKEACTIFATVLGPGADEAHGNHLHLDMRVRKANYRICQ